MSTEEKIIPMKEVGEPDRNEETPEVITPEQYVICAEEAISYSDDLKCIDALKLLLGGVLFTIQHAHATISDVHPEKAEEVKRELYDLVNIGASNILKKFAPEFELRPDLTAEAIMKAENEILDDFAEECDT